MDLERKILHVDMDAFYAAVEVRDNPSLKGKPVIIGSLPGERGVVATCNYKAREYGVRSAMPISTAYKLCPHGVFMHPNFHKYEAASAKIRAIWQTYSDTIEYIALDEGFIDITSSLRLFGGAREIARQIKKRTWEELGLTCSIGLGYCMSAAKLASEENKPNGYFELMTPAALQQLIYERPTRTVYLVGEKTAERLGRMGIHYVKDIYAYEKRICEVMGNTGRSIVNYAKGFDTRQVNTRTRDQSIGKEQTFQEDITDFTYLNDVLRLIARKLALRLKNKNIYAKTISLKLTYSGFIQISRAQSGAPTDSAKSIYEAACQLLQKVEQKPVRLIGITVSNFVKDKQEITSKARQLNLFDPIEEKAAPKKKEKLENLLTDLQQKHGMDILKTASELAAEKKIRKEDHYVRTKKNAALE